MFEDNAKPYWAVLEVNGPTCVRHPSSHGAGQSVNVYESFDDAKEKAETQARRQPGTTFAVVKVVETYCMCELRVHKYE